MTEPTPLYDATTAALDPQAVNATVDGATATVTAAGGDALNLPPGPDTIALQAFTDAIPDEGHRAIAQALVDAFTVRDQQLQAFIVAYNTAMGDIGALQTTVADLQTQVAALTTPVVP